MSSSTPLPPGLNPEASDGTRGNYGQSSQDGYGVPQTPHQGQSDSGSQSSRSFLPEQSPQQPFSLFRLDMPAGQLFYQPQPFMMPQSFSQQAPPFNVQGTSSMNNESSDFKGQRKAKGHVASACVPCKKAHLRCDAQRPCSRCVSNGKEETCIDVQHKKRGRPRLRDERETRYDGVPTAYGHQPSDNALRRPPAFYTPRDAPISTPFADSLQRSGSYRVLKSQGTNSNLAPLSGPIPPHFLDQAVQNSNVYGTSPSSTGILASQEPVYAFLNFELRIVKTSATFQDAVGVPSLVSRRLQEVVITSDIERISRIQKSFESGRRDLDPNYLPTIYTKPEDDRIIQTVGFGQDDLSRIPLDRQDTLTFLGADNRHRCFDVRMGLGKKESTYFIAITLLAPPPVQQQYTHAPQPSRDSFLREQQFGFPAQPPGYMQHGGPSSYSQPHQGYGPSMSSYQPGSMSQPPQNMQYAQGSRQGYSQLPPQPQYHSTPSSQTYQPAHHHNSQLGAPSSQQQYPRPPPQSQYQDSSSEMRTSQDHRQRDLQLPPIRDSTLDNAVEPRNKDDRSGRLDIGGLIDRPESSRRGN